MSGARLSVAADLSFSGVPVRLVVEDPRAEAALVACFVSFCLDDPSRPSSTDVTEPVMVELASVPVLPTEPAATPWLSHPPLRAHRRDDGWLFHDGVGALEVHPLRGFVRGVLRADADEDACWRFATASLWVAIMECVRARGRYLVHAAAVVDPAGPLVILPGPSGAGKTTAALALVEAGFHALSDDMICLERDSGGALEVVTHRRSFHLCRDLVSRRPHLSRAVTEPPARFDRRKQWLDLEAVFPGRQQTRFAGPKRIFFPEIVAGPTSSVEPLSPREALLRLFRQSSFLFLEPSLAPAHLDVLRALVDEAPAHRLACGADRLAAPERYVELLARVSGV